MSQLQASAPISPLRRRMLDDMAMRGLHEDTQRNYIASVRSFAAFLGRSPETATPEDVRRFQIHQADSGVQPPPPCLPTVLRTAGTLARLRPRSTTRCRRCASCSP